MRLRFLSLISLCAVFLTALPTRAQDGEIKKVLPHFLDLQGRHTLSPSLYERDAYQFHLRQHPEEQSALRYDIQWKSGLPRMSALTLQIELLGSNQELDGPVVVSKQVSRDGWFSTWSAIEITGEEFKALGEVVSWRATLWSGNELLDSQQSFLWQKEEQVLPGPEGPVSR